MFNNKKQNILISGASGFLGQEIIKQLMKENNYQVIALTSREKELLNKFGDSPNLVVFDTNKWFRQEEKAISIDMLVNCAFPRSSDPEQLVDGINFTEKLIKNSIKFNIPKIINISSQSVYSQKAKTSTNENSPVIPESLYGMAKYTTERIVATLCEGTEQNVTYSNIRLASLTGIDLEMRMLNKFVRKALNKESITINGGSKLISYLHVKDAASALMSMIMTDATIWKPTYNLGNHYSYSLHEVAEIVNRIGCEHSINGVEIKVKKANDDFNNLINSDLFYSDFKWEPNYDVPLMVDELFKHYKNIVSW